MKGGAAVLHGFDQGLLYVGVKKRQQHFVSVDEVGLRAQKDKCRAQSGAQPENIKVCQRRGLLLA
jgi:hypothetical protein